MDNFESEPVATISRDVDGFKYVGWLQDNIWQKLGLNTKLYTTPQPNRVAELEAKLAKVEIDKARLVETLSDVMKSQMLNRICQKGIVAKCLCPDCVTDKAYALLAEMEAK